MSDQRISVEAGEPTQSRSRMPLAAAAVLAVVLAGFFATADFSDAEDLSDSTTTLAASTTTTTPVATTQASPALAILPTRTYEAGALETLGYEWDRLPLPAGMDEVVAVGRFEQGLIAVGGPRAGDGSLRRLAVSKWFPRSPTSPSDSTWFPVGFVTGRRLIVQDVVIDEDLIVVIGREAPSANALVGSTYAFVSGNGVIFDEYQLGTGAEVTDVTAVVRRGQSVWIFGGHRSDPWTEIEASLPREIRTLIAEDLVSVSSDGGDVVITREPGLELARFAIFDVVGHFVDPDTPPVWTAKAWTLESELRSLSGGRFDDREVEVVEPPFGDAVVDLARVDDLGDLVVDVRSGARHERWRLIEDDWAMTASWSASSLRAIAGRAETALYLDRGEPVRLMRVDDEGGRPLEFETPLHDLSDSRIVGTVGPGAVVGTGLAGNLNPPALLEVGRSLTTVRVAPDGTTSVWRAGTLIYSAPLERMVEQGRVDLTEGRLYLGDEDGTELAYLDFAELRQTDQGRTPVPGAVGVLYSPDLAGWTFTELNAPGSLVASYVDDESIVVATGIPATAYSNLPATIWLGRPPQP